MPQNLDVILPLFLDQLQTLFTPTIKGWNRLEGRPRSKEFNRSMRAEIHDPLWMLTRQWQFGEFKGEDAGSPVDTQVAVRQTSLNEFIVNGAARSYHGEVPLEVMVERDFLQKDIIQQVELFRYLMRLLAAEPNLTDIRKALISNYPLDEKVAGFRDKNSLQYLRTVTGKSADGYKIMKDFDNGDFTVLEAMPLTPDEIAGIKSKLKDLSDHHKRLYSQPADETENAWKTSKLEYQFSCAANSPAQENIFLNAGQYSQGNLDWFDFNIENKFSYKPGSENVTTPATINDEALSFIPAPVSFNGMPAPRFWEMENQKTDFADLDVNPTDTVKLLLTEFALIYGNDWCVVPYKAAIGSVIDLRAMIVTDCFGEKTLIKAAGRGVDDDWQRWNIFGLNTENFYADNRMFLAPALVKSLEGEPVEKVSFLRDEISNMVWAVTNTVTTAIGIGVNAFESAKELRNQQPQLPVVNSPVDLVYSLGKEVPFNWTPFVPAHLPSSARAVRLQRAMMPNSPTVLRGRVLDGEAPFFINEEEVPRSGKVVTQSFQRTRGLKGETYLWLGRKIRNGRGEGSSGLTFDQLETKR